MMCRLEFWSSLQTKRSMRTRLLNCEFITASCRSSAQLGPGGSVPVLETDGPAGSRPGCSAHSGPWPPKPRPWGCGVRLHGSCAGLRAAGCGGHASPQGTAGPGSSSECRGLPALGVPWAWVWEPSHSQGSSELLVQGPRPWPGRPRLRGAPGPGSLACASCPGPGLTYSFAPPVRGHWPASHRLQDVQQGLGVSLLYDAWGRKGWVVTRADAGRRDTAATQTHGDTPRPVLSAPLPPGCAVQATEGPGSSGDGMRV